MQIARDVMCRRVLLFSLVVIVTASCESKSFIPAERANVYHHRADDHEIACREETPWLDAAQHGFDDQGIQGRDPFLIEQCPPSRAYVYSKNGEPQRICRLEWQQSSNNGYEYQGLKPRASYTIEDCN